MPFFSQAIAASPSTLFASIPELVSYRAWDNLDLDGDGTPEWDDRSSSGEGSDSNPFRVGLPEYSAGDYCVICLINSDTLSEYSMTATPSGWTRITPANSNYGNATSDAEFGMWGKLMDGTEGRSISMGSQTASLFAKQVGATFTLSNINDTDPVDALGNTITGTSSSFTIPSVSSTEGGLLFTFVAFDGSDGDPFNLSNSGNVTYDYEVDFDTDNTGQTGTSGAIKIASINPSTNTGSVSISNSSSDGFLAGHVILK